MNKKLSFFSLFALIFSAIVNMKNMPATALFGSPLVFFFICSAIFFLIPTALVSAKLSAAFPENGGIYQWVSRAFGDRVAMTAVWLQWSNTMVWYPTMLSFIAGALAYLIYPELADNKAYLITCILVVFWGVTWINLKGIHASSKLTNICTWVGTIFPMALLILMGIIWIIRGERLQISLSPQSMIPSFTSLDSWTALIAIMASFLGIELSGAHANEVEDPKKNFPRAICLAAFCIFITLSLSALSVAIVLPGKDIHLIAGVMQVFSSFLNLFGLGVLTPLLAIAVALGSIGTMVGWLISPAKGLLRAAEVGFLPSVFTKKNEHGVASRVLLVQAIIVSLFSFVFLFQSSANEFFWLLTALSTELYMIMYVLMFFSALKLQNKELNPEVVSSFKLSTGWLWILSSFGLVGCIVTIIVAFIPPQNLEISQPFRYLFFIGLANFIAVCPLFFFFAYRKRQRFVQDIVD
jgi:amino acid transporter